MSGTKCIEKRIENTGFFLVRLFHLVCSDVVKGFFFISMNNYLKNKGEVLY